MPLSRSNTNQSCSNLAALPEQLEKAQDDAARKPATTSMVKASAQIATSFTDSPQQKALNHFLQVDYKQGHKPKDAQRIWMGIRKLTSQMDTLEKANAKIGRTVSSADYISSARSMSRMIGKLVSILPNKETQHPAFRSELRHHMGKMCEWNPYNKQAWNTAYDHLERSEAIEVQGELYDKRACLGKASGVAIMKYRP